jgi:HK97 family phage prohead protease
MADTNLESLNDRQRLQVQEAKAVVEMYGQYDQTTGANGAHYAPAEVNPFKAEGLICANCVFFEGAGACEIVSGSIEAEAVCKLWIIPENLINASEREPMDTLTFSANIEAADLESRVIRGTVVTFGEVGNTSAGPTVFEPGSITVPEDVSTVRFNLEHDRTRPIGRASELRAADNTIEGAFKIAGTRAGDDALLEASDGLRDGMSVGVRVIKAASKDGVLHVSAAQLDEVSLVAFPAIASAKVASVAASETPDSEAAPAPETPKEEEVMDTTAVAEAPVVEASIPVAIPAATTSPRLPDLGTYLAAAANQQRDPHTWESITAALAEQKLADNTGIVPAPIVGPIVDTLLAQRPFVNAVPNRTMPSAGKQFTRPKVTAHTTVGAQSSELAELSSHVMTVGSLTVTKGTYGGALRLSVQDRDFSDPAVLPLLVEDMVKVYARETDNAAADAFVTAVTDTVTLAANATVDTVIAAIYTAASQVNGSINQLPDTIFASPDQWARLGSLVDTSKRPVFPNLAPQNAAGQMNAGSFSANPLGLNLVVDSNFASGTLIVGRAEFTECWEQAGGQLQVALPGSLGFELSYYGYFASLTTEATAFRKLAPAS